MTQIEKEFSQDLELLTVLTFEPRLCTLHELQTVYSLDDLYDFLEIIEVHSALKEEGIRKAEAQAVQAARNNK